MPKATIDRQCDAIAENDICYHSGLISDRVRPFVNGITPIVGSEQIAQNSIAKLAAADHEAKLSAIAEGNANRQNEKLRRFFQRAERAEFEGGTEEIRRFWRFEDAVPRSGEYIEPF